LGCSESAVAEVIPETRNVGAIKKNATWVQACFARIVPLLERLKHFGVSASEVAPMSKEKPNDDPRESTDAKTTRQTDEPWKGPVEKDRKPGDSKPDLEKWHDTNTH
jgi:hypothetical protein